MDPPLGPPVENQNGGQNNANQQNPPPPVNNNQNLPPPNPRDRRRYQRVLMDEEGNIIDEHDSDPETEADPTLDPPADPPRKWVLWAADLGFRNFGQACSVLHNFTVSNPIRDPLFAL
jgi:hypothetical protein